MSDEKNSMEEMPEIEIEIYDDIDSSQEDETVANKSLKTDVETSADAETEDSAETDVKKNSESDDEEIPDFEIEIYDEVDLKSEDSESENTTFFGPRPFMTGAAYPPPRHGMPPRPGIPPRVHQPEIHRSAPVPMSPRKKKKRESASNSVLRKILLAMALGAIFGIFAGAGIYIINCITRSMDGERAQIRQEANTGEPKSERQPAYDKPVPAIDNTPAISEGGTAMMDASYVAENCMPSIVAITNKYTETYESFWGQSEKYQNESSGSGIIVGENEKELLIVTNTHVIEGFEELYVQFADGETYSAGVKGSRAAEDLAIVAVSLSDMKQSTLDSIKAATLGDSDVLRVGEPVIAIGNSLGYGQSVTSGIISALDRDFEYEGGVRKVVQTDAAINPGNSGGALLNIKGEVIGINEAKYSSTAVEGVGYAIPISAAKPIIDELVTKSTKSKVQEHEKGFLGISGVDVTDEVSNMYMLPKGVYIRSVEADSAAAKAGIQERDVILEFDGETVTTMEELQNIISYYPAGANVKLKIYRGNDTIELEATLGKRPTNAE